MKRFVAAVLLAVAALAAPAAHATFPGKNGEIAYTAENPTEEYLWLVSRDPATGSFEYLDRGGGFDPVWSPDGRYVAYDYFGVIYKLDTVTHEISFVTNSSDDLFMGNWSPDGSKLAYVHLGNGVWVVGADGTGDHQLAGPGSGLGSWSADGTRLAISNTSPSGIATINPDGTGLTQLTTGPDSGPRWSPDGRKIAFYSTRGPTGIYLMDADGGNQRFVTTSTTWYEWSPDGTRIAFVRNDGDDEIYVMNADGSGITKLTDNTALNENDVHWSPDGTKLVFERDGSDVFTMNADGTGQAKLAKIAAGESDYGADWRPIPVTAYPRPKGATPMYLSLVPSYAPCAAPNGSHGAPLSFGSCTPPSRQSSILTVGTPDANGQGAKSIGFAFVAAKLGNPSTPADEADVGLALNVTDVRKSADLTDYAGALEARPTLRITDRDNTPAPGGPGAATVTDVPLPFSVPCTVTTDTTVGSTCAVNTTADAVLAGAVKESRRSVWAVERFEVRDADGNAFLTQGLFIP